MATRSIDTKTTRKCNEYEDVVAGTGRLSEAMIAILTRMDLCKTMLIKSIMGALWWETGRISLFHSVFLQSKRKEASVDRNNHSCRHGKKIIKKWIKPRAIVQDYLTCNRFELMASEKGTKLLKTNEFDSAYTRWSGRCDSCWFSLLEEPWYAVYQEMINANQSSNRIYYCSIDQLIDSWENAKETNLNIRHRIVSFMLFHFRQFMMSIDSRNLEKWFVISPNSLVIIS